MTDKTIANLIARLNARRHKDTIFLRPISSTVDYAKVWLSKPSETDRITNSSNSQDFYFIKNSQNKYVAAIYVMGRELHWYVLQKYRKQGHLTEALTTTILPHLFLSKEEILASIDLDALGDVHFQNSERVALKAGFIKASENEYYLKKSDFNGSAGSTGTNPLIDEQRLTILKKRMYLAANLLNQVKDEMETAYDAPDNLDEIISEIKSSYRRLEDMFWANKNLLK
jgi:RimJ/RimL family protein N-acetyltransferase